MAETLTSSNGDHWITLEERRQLSGEVFELCCTRPAGFHFLAGQHVGLRIGQLERDYTIVSARQEPRLRFLVEQLEAGLLSSRLASLALGSSLEMGPPRGYLVERATARQRVLVATGSGIAPFVSMLSSGFQARYLLQGARRPDQLYYRRQVSPLVDNYVGCLTAPGCLAKGKGWVYPGQVTAYIDQLLPVEDYDFYLCGKWEMIRQATHIIDRRFPEAKVFSEGFY
ncbi:ferredoxin--NADP reductase [Desulfogranum mediterraneum]|uniref:ferredoxin--NADP reductase n=1 Tax=Desulfogranum mediterraneum TaxID=160661 RepID=UPI000420A6B1|nr:FAD-binding oxidoreductase [Desulfogranum mediterraneum]